MKKSYSYTYTLLWVLLMFPCVLSSQVVLEKEVKITDLGLHFNGSKVTSGTKFNSDDGNRSSYDFYFGRNISAHGDCIKTYGDYVFMTWYRGGESDRHVMLTRYNTNTGTSATIEFPHRHTGFQNKPWIGESHNTIAVGISPLDGTIHLLYDMHAYSASRPSNGSLANDYFRYSYSVKDAAALPDADFTLDKFVQNGTEGYKHLRMPGTAAQSEFVSLTYPKFFQNDDGDLFMLMREGGNNNGMYKFIKYDANTGDWGNFIDFNRLNAKSQPGIDYNWGLYGDMKYVNGKFRIGFQRRLANNNDKYLYQNGVYYAYSDNQTAATGWKNHKGESFSLPLWDADFIKVMEPGDYVATTNPNRVRIVGGFDWTVTANGDVHIKSQVRDLDNNITKNLHTYKPAGTTEFITTVKSIAGSFYTSGPNVYTVGLKNGRVVVYKAEGGTDNFEKVYEATGGRRYDHGVVHIENGKAYYYLMEDKSGNAQPLYLQIIDLDVEQEPFRVSLSSPVEGETYNIDDTVQISADAVDENGSISKVEFLINGAYFAEDNTAPYSVDWTPGSEGVYTIQAVAYNASNETVSSTEITINAEVFDPNDLIGQAYRLKNIATGKYLKSSGSNVIESDYVNGDDALNWTFVKTTISGSEYYNIDSEVNGVLRGAGSGADNAIISTGRPSPNTDVDKVWTAYYIQGEDAYRFSVKDGNNFLYHEAVNEYLNKTADITDARSQWKLELASNAPLSVNENQLTIASVKVYPNPANGNFNIVLNGFSNADVVINDMLGKEVYRNIINSNRLEVENNNRFKSGLYLIKVTDDYQKVYYTKLVVR